MIEYIPPSEQTRRVQQIELREGQYFSTYEPSLVVTLGEFVPSFVLLASQCGADLKLPHLLCRGTDVIQLLIG